MPIALYGDAFHAVIEAAGGAVHASKADPVKEPGWTVLYAVAAVALARANANSDAARTRARNDALIATLRRGSMSAWAPMMAFLGGKRTTEPTKRSSGPPPPNGSIRTDRSGRSIDRSRYP